jgi:cation-transporting ATPase E
MFGRKREKEKTSGEIKPVETKPAAVLPEPQVNNEADTSHVSKKEEVESAKKYAKEKLKLDSDETIELQIVKKIPGSKALMKRKAEKAYEEAMRRANVERYTPDISLGLSSDMVLERVKEGMTNKTPKTYTKSYLRIIVDNLFTYFNVLMLVILILMLVAGDATFTDYSFAYIVALNLIIGIIEEIKAKQITDKLKLIVAPKTTVIRNGVKISVDNETLVLDDVIVLEEGGQIPTDAIVKSGVVEVNESLQTGESKPIKKQTGDKLLAGSFVVSGSCVSQVDSVGEDTFAGKIASQAKLYKKDTSVLNRAISSFIKIVSLIVLPVGILMGFTNFQAASQMTGVTNPFGYALTKTSASVVQMIPSGLVLLTSVALTVGVLRLAKKKALVQDLYSIERLARVNCVCFDKTGTLTDGTLRVREAIKLDAKFEDSKVIPSFLYAFPHANHTALALQTYYKDHGQELEIAETLAFSSARKFSAVTFRDNGTFVLGAPEYLYDGKDERINKIIKDGETEGCRVVLFGKTSGSIKGDNISGHITPLVIFIIEDHIKEDAPQTIKWFVDNGVQIKVISGDSPRTVAEIAKRCGVPESNKYVSLEGISLDETARLADRYTVFGRVSPDQKAALIKALKNQGKSVAMTGDGVNDILAMKQADCAIAMASGADATRSAAHVVLMNSDFASMPDIVKEGRRVVNNIQISASLFIMKSFFTIVLSLSIIIANFAQAGLVYPFDPHHFFLLETFPIGLDAFFLGLQPNSKKISGDFTKEVFRNSLPGAFCMFASVFLLLIFEKYNIFNIAAGTISVNGRDRQLITVSYTSMMVFCIDISAFMTLFKVCYRFNWYRTIVYLVSGTLVFTCLFFLKERFSGFVKESLTGAQWMCLLYIALGFLFVHGGIWLINFLANKKVDFKMKANTV